MSTPIDLSGKKPFITGGTRGIGLAIANKLAVSGADIALGFRSDSKSAESAVSAIKRAAPDVNVCSVQGDLSEDQSARSLAHSATGALGGAIDIVVLNA